MDLKIAELSNKIRELIKDDLIYIEFLEASKELENSDEAKILSYRKDVASVKYEDALRHFDKNSKEVLDASKEMSEAIYKLNQHPVVKRYNIALSLYNQLLKEVEKAVFEGLYD